MPKESILLDLIVVDLVSVATDMCLVIKNFAFAFSSIEAFGISPK